MDPREIAHDYDCMCDCCRNMILAIIAQDADGEYFFTDEELKEICK